MNLYFWQNCVSPHQLPYIKELYGDSRVEKVYIISPVWNLSGRAKMGWSENGKSENVEFIIAPDDIKIINLLSQSPKNSVHLFSGIRADEFVFKCFRISLRYTLKRGLITEPPFDYKKPLLLHYIRFWAFDYKYISKINYVFAISRKAFNYYSTWSQRWKIFPFCYAVETKGEIYKKIKTDTIRFLYVGSLIKLKNVMLLLMAFKQIQARNKLRLMIIGDGNEKKKLIQYTENNNLVNKVEFWGNQPMSVVHGKMPDYDVLVLPSMRDGWGAVVNEGLQSGLFVITSSNCGAKELIENSKRGLVFKNNNLASLTNSLNYCIKNIEQIRSERNERIKWTENIKGAAIAKYLVDCLCEDNDPNPPWQG